MVVRPCRVSLHQNGKLHLHHEPARRKRKDHPFIGVYASKAVRYVGRVEAIAVVPTPPGAAREELGRLTDAHRARIDAAILESPPFDLTAEPHRFYLVDRFVPTDFKKASPGPVRRVAYLDLAELVPGFDGHAADATDTLARLLEGRSFT